MRVWLVRHGPTHEKAFVGWRDVPADLSDHARLARLAAHLPQDAHIVASDLIRASATADAIAARRPRIADQPALREFDFGVWDGMHHSQVAARDPDLSRRFWEQPGDLAAPGGESWNSVAARVSQKIDDLTKICPFPNLIVVAHIGVIMTQIQRATDGVAYHAMSHQIDNLSVTDMRRTSDGWQIGTINHCP